MLFSLFSLLLGTRTKQKKKQLEGQTVSPSEVKFWQKKLKRVFHPPSGRPAKASFSIEKEKKRKEREKSYRKDQEGFKGEKRRKEEKKKRNSGKSKQGQKAEKTQFQLSFEP